MADAEIYKARDPITPRQSLAHPTEQGVPRVRCHHPRIQPESVDCRLNTVDAFVGVRRIGVIDENLVFHASACGSIVTLQVRIEKWTVTPLADLSTC